MFVHDSRLPHLLAPACFHAEEHYRSELKTILLPGWHLLASRADLPQPGDFLTCELLGSPLLVRNCDGVIQAFLNVCAHRHCLLTSLPRGSSRKLSCQYHGWEYDRHGRTAKIPVPKSFQPFDRQVDRLVQYRVEMCGQLVFVSLSSDAPSLAESLGSHFSLCAERFGDDWRQFLRLEPDYGVNWKIPIENALESYHVPCVHPDSFREDPGAERSTHVLNETSTSFGTQLPFSPHSRTDRLFQRLEQRFLGTLGVAPSGAYWHHHIFPLLLLSFTDAVSLVQAVIPTSRVTARGVVRQFSRYNRSWPAWQRGLAGAWGRMAAQITRGILQEDLRILPDIQRGLEASPHRGALGSCEERIHAFQQFVAARTGAAPAAAHGQADGADRAESNGESRQSDPHCNSCAADDSD